MAVVKWQIFADAGSSQPLYAGTLPPQQLQAIRRYEDVCVRPSGVVLSPSIARESRRLLQQSGAPEAADAAEFLVPAEELTLFQAGTGGQDAVSPTSHDTALFCRLELQPCDEDAIIEDAADAATSDWFRWKISRASAYRSRGNEAFKRSRLHAARRLYAKALAWLECPSECAFDVEELSTAAPLATACHVNLATCWWKLGEMDACIAQCSRALALDERHVKARYRRGQAYLSSKEFDLALADLAAVLELEPDNKLFASSLERARAARQQFHRKQREAFAKLFPS